MSLILRLQKLSALTNQEMDGNFIYLEEQIEGVRGDVDELLTTTIPTFQSGITSTLTGKQTANNKLTSLSNNTTAGLLSISGDTITSRTITAGSTNIVITNGSGVAGNPVVNIGSDVVTATSTHALTNKTISGATNSIQDVSLTTSVTGTLPIANGGTNATTAVAARASLDALARPITNGIVIKDSTNTAITRQLAVSGSGLTIDFADGLIGNPRINIASSSSNTINTVVIRDGNGNFDAGIITATLNGACLGNAASVTNGVYTNVEYSNPAWITSLAGSKITSIPNSSLQNSSITINGTVVPLGGSVNVPDVQARSISNVADTIVLRNTSGNFSAGTITAALIGNVTGNVTGNTIGTHTGNVIGNVTGNVTGSASDNVLKTGDSMSGFLNLHADPTELTHAATKRYVDTRIPQYVFTSGFSNTVSYTNNGAVGDFDYFDVFPPQGKTMSDIIAFIPSIRIIQFAGKVNGDDTLRCTYAFFGDRVRVYVQNTEQRGLPAANWLAVWR